MRDNIFNLNNNLYYFMYDDNYWIFYVSYFLLLHVLHALFVQTSECIFAAEFLNLRNHDLSNVSRFTNALQSRAKS